MPAQVHAKRQQQTLWSDDKRRRSVLEALSAAADEGLDADDYALPAGCAAADTPADPNACEHALTDAVLRYAADVSTGALRADAVDPNWFITQRTFDADALLSAIATQQDPGGLLRALPPPHAGYRQLRTALAQYRAQFADVQWAALPSGPSLRRDMHDQRVAAVRERLAAEQPALQETADPQLFDAVLEEAVKAFQLHNGLDADGVIGRQTLAALSVTPAQRIAQIRLNMERWRWLPRDLGAQYIQVNLAAYQLQWIRNGAVQLTMRTVNGRPERSSPVFTASIDGVVVNPDWTVPQRIAVEDLLPQLQHDPRSLLAKQIQILQPHNGKFVVRDPTQIDWQRYHRGNFPFVLRQAPGPQNSLGRIKFSMPNRHAVFLHDTPARALFAKSARAFSSGCVRVEQAVTLAEQLLALPTGAAVLAAALASGQTQTLPVRPAVPVHLLYLTAWVDAAGNLQFASDVYGRDTALADRFSF